MSAKLVSAREILKNVIKRAVKFATTPPEGTTFSDVEARVKSVDQAWEKVVDVHIEIESMTGETELEFQEIEFEDIETNYYTAVARLQILLVRLKPPTQSSSSSVQDRPINIRQEVRREVEIKLPTIDIPKFSGRYDEWPSFNDLFTSLIRIRDNLSNSQKLHYLKLNVEGDAAQLLRSYAITDANYDVAWKTLDERYNNKRLIVNANFKRLFEQKQLVVESASNLRSLLDKTNEIVRALTSLELPTEHWDSILVYILAQKLDVETHKQWELSLNHNNIPTFKELVTFLEVRCRSLEAISSESCTTKANRVTSDKFKNTKVVGRSSFHAATNMNCVVCGGNHKIYHCTVFGNFDAYKRADVARENKLCFNCLRRGHSAGECKQDRCKKCNQGHNTMLHFPKQLSKPNDQSKVVNFVSNCEANTSNSVQNCFGGTSDENKQILLATARIKIEVRDGVYEEIRVLLDSGSQASFVTENCVQRLRLKKRSTSIPISGLGVVAAGSASSYVHFKIKSNIDDSFCISVNALVFNKLTNMLPSYRVNVAALPQFSGITLADPKYYEPGEIDALIGADIYGSVLRGGIISGGECSPSAQNTVFGWVLYGPMLIEKSLSTNVATINVHSAVIDDLRKFWEIEEVGLADIRTEDEKLCEKHFEITHQRNEEGRYVVSLPFKSSSPKLGESKQSAIKRLLQIENKLLKSDGLREQYIDFMREYKVLNHMQQVTSSDKDCYYLPHHFVLKDSSTTKLRVVFDASCKTTSGVSLNEKQLIGPKLQDDLMMIILRFREHKIGVTADIAKMYRQVLINENDRKYQKILWRESESEPIKEYSLNTVTYGMASAPYLAIRALRQLATDEEQLHSESSVIVLRDFYVDDLVTGFETEVSAIKSVNDLIVLLGRGGFELRKWSSNNINVLNSIPAEYRECEPVQLQFECESGPSIKTLGLNWFAMSDEFGYVVNPATVSTKVTKRNILSSVAQLYDPLGLLAPSIILGKILLQRLWTLGLGWDEEVPSDVQIFWKSYQSSFELFEKIRVCRWLGTNRESYNEIYGFCDASEDAYAAVLYMRTISNGGYISVQLITAKTKVAPIKQISLPKLELCAAVLLVKLLVYVRRTIRQNIKNYYVYSDSQVVLSWLRKLPRHWKTFIANRVSYIQSETSPDKWRHIKSEMNPADCASRGIMPSELVIDEMWWHGPQWLSLPEEQWPVGEIINGETDLEKRSKVVMMAQVDPCWDLIDKYSSLNQLKRVTAYIIRFITNCRRLRSGRVGGPLSTREVQCALEFWIRCTQQQYFGDEIVCCKNNKQLLRSSTIIRLNPFLDDCNVLRLRGRLSAINTNHKYNQIILPKKSKLTNLIVTDCHLRLLHGGVQLMLATLRQCYWIVSGRSVARKCVHSCVTCFRQKPKTCGQLMGNLPRERITPGKPFSCSGVDYAGPILMKASSGRGVKTVKGYVALFVCFVTKAVHIEAVTDLTTIAFVAAFRRFVAIRGRCDDLHSDCGTNFVGANRELGIQLRAVLNDPNVPRECSLRGTNWHFIPPGAPHFGGLWESGIKSIKFHLRRVIGDVKLTYEEMATVLSEISACLNSRPLSPVSDDHDDMVALTPGHFLVTEPLVVVPHSDLTSTPTSRCDRWQLTRKLMQDFWYRWRKEYLNNLQQRPKWLRQEANVQVGKLVLIKDERYPPGKWPLARVIELHPGSDGLVRVVSLKHQKNIVKKPIHKICVLPVVD